MSKEDGDQVPIIVQVENYALKFLINGRKEWDVPHTRSVVHYATEIGQSVGLDLLVEQTAAWFHDIGYFGLFKDGDSDNLFKVKNKKELHMKTGQRMARDFLARPEIAGFYTPEQSNRVSHLVSVHDNLPVLGELDELVLMEADTLGTLDVTRVKPTFNYDDAMRYLESTQQRRIPKFITELGKGYANSLIPQFEEHFRSILIKSPVFTGKPNEPK